MTEAQAIDYIVERGARHGLSYDDVLEMIPDILHDDLVECAEFLELRHISHILPQSTHPELANDPSNMILENPKANLSRGADPMSETEEMIAMLDNEVLATQIDSDVVIDIIPDYVPIFGLV